MRTILLSTDNQGKIRELEEMMKGFVTVLKKADYGLSGLVVQEDADTLEGNARKKVQALADALSEEQKSDDLWILADDTGLFVQALQGAPGVHTARYAGEGATDAQNRQHLREELQKHAAWREDVEPGIYVTPAYFETVIALWNAGEVQCVRGRLEGGILSEERGTNGFGYDSLFYLPEQKKTLAELEESVKNTFSHRARAFQQALPIVLREE